MRANKHRRSPLALYLTISGIFVACTMFIMIVDDRHPLGIGTLPFFSSLVSLVWMVNSMHQQNKRPRYWLYILLALINLTIGNFLWLLLKMQYLDSSNRFISNLFWIFSYPLFLMALID